MLQLRMNPLLYVMNLISFESVGYKATSLCSYKMLLFLGAFATFCGLDYFLAYLNVQGVYYGLHALHNAMIVYLTAGDVWTSLTDFKSVATTPVNFDALQLCFALHLYHIALYHSKFRMDDWLHHGLMIGVALPMGGLLPSGSLLGYSLFFTTGLPGGIDYVLLFLQRNGFISKITQKRVNTQLNVWVRSPGCISMSALTLAHISVQKDPSLVYVLGSYIEALLNYWNGQYFMEQVVYNAGENRIFNSLLDQVQV